MTKSDSSNPEQVRSIPYNGDLYHVYHINGVVLSIAVRFDNAGTRDEPIAWEDLPPALQQIIDDTINFGDRS